jgi:hypothetical protein
VRRVSKLERKHVLAWKQFNGADVIGRAELARELAFRMSKVSQALEPADFGRGPINRGHIDMMTERQNGDLPTWKSGAVVGLARVSRVRRVSLGARGVGTRQQHADDQPESEKHLILLLSFSGITAEKCHN